MLFRLDGMASRMEDNRKDNKNMRLFTAVIIRAFVFMKGIH